jgi:Plasmid encoded RepA protein
VPTTEYPDINSLEAETTSLNFESESIVLVDADLLTQWEAVKHFEPKLREMSLKRLQSLQKRRNETLAKREAMTPIQRRRDVAHEKMSEQPLEKGDIHHIHTGLALCGLPYKRPPEEIHMYEKKYGFMNLRLEAGSLIDPHSGDWIQQGLPYGTKARLMLLHICTQAMRQKSPDVELDESMSGFIRSLGFAVTGGKKGTIGLFKEQLNRLAACRMQVGLWDGKGGAKTLNLAPIESFEVWFPSNPDQKILWPSTVTLNHKFYESLQKHALPVDIRALSAVSHSALQMDILLWLSYRLKALQGKYFLTWDLLKSQFCQSEAMRMIDFQRQFKQDLADIQTVFDRNMPIKITEKGLLLKPTDPERLFIPPKKTIAKT